MINIIILAVIGYYGVSPNTKYKVGSCYYLIDPENGIGEETDILKIDSITKTGINYRWWVLNNSWAVETNYRNFEMFDKLTRSRECPNE